MEIALRKRGLAVEREVPFEIYFEGECVGLHRVDMLVEHHVALEIKAVKALTEIHHRQLLNYVTALGLELGMLLHFGPEAKFYRVLGRRVPDAKRSDPGKSGPSG
jgi:GxxExxY protein